MSSTNSEIVEEYRKIRPNYEKLTILISKLLESLLKMEEIEYIPPIESRTKTIFSLADKLNRKKYNDPLKEITDFTGCRILLYYPQEISKVEDLIKENFKVDEKNTINKKEDLPKNQFGYGGINYVVSIKKDRTELPEYIPYKNYKFEIQIQTICEYTWAIIQRKIEYKSEDLISNILSRKLARLSALLELADDEFQRIRNQGLQELMDQEISFASLLLYVENSKIIKQICKEINKKGFPRMMKEDDITYMDELMNSCEYLKYEFIGGLNMFITKENATTLFEKILENGVNISIGPISLMLMIIYFYNDGINYEYLQKKGWVDPILTILTKR